MSYVIAYVDRVNVGFAKLKMQPDLEPLGFSESAFGFGMGIFFVGYLLLEIPGTLLVERWSARKWISRIMISWGIVAALTAFVHYRVPGVTGLAELMVRGLASLLIRSPVPIWVGCRERLRRSSRAAWAGQPIRLAVLLGAVLARSGRSGILSRRDRLPDSLVSTSRPHQVPGLVFHRHSRLAAIIGPPISERVMSIGADGNPPLLGYGRLAMGVHRLGYSRR